MKHRLQILILGLALIAGPCFAQLGGAPAAYSRMGFGPRGIGMGNAMTAVVTGDVVSFYNPGLTPWASPRSGMASFGVLGLDRQLNTLSYQMLLPPTAGLFVGILNSGVTNIDGRDADGEQTGILSTAENQAILGFGIKLRAGWSAGINIKFLYYRLYNSVSSLTVGIDLGAVVPLGHGITVGAAMRDLSSKYKWDTGPLFGQSGQASEDLLPLLTSVGAAWQLPDSLLLVSAEVEISNNNSLIARAGVEIPIIPELVVRGGVDRIDLKEKGNGIKPSLGFSASKPLDGWTPSIQYAYVFEPFAPQGIHIIALSVRF